MDEARARSGRCACGAVRIAVTGPPIITHACHCTYCQRESGSAFGLNCLHAADAVAIEGPVERVVTPSASGKDQWILRCAECHVAVSGHYSHAREKIHFVRAGVLEDKAGIAPDVHIHTRAKMDWVSLDPEVPAFEDFYDARDFWSEEQMRRWKAAARG
ncbi:GFA family protein [Sphingomicrobium astaxanthinifaciens]|uniref:GFA family protein n=1 Tax=Sphingomicrobium astaxanthinifaciens TaxID=1227949 RepID=UPI001FCBDAB7|nr:GFA family protein [Sphingomicrobium astaxanthinifaciens]MCJ7420537.1 GFA family protein [Sphingomicrobium astaxanthinifaciens]